MTDGPTRGVETLPDRQSWAARPTTARVMRVGIVLAPACTSLVVTWVVAPHLYRPAGLLGIAVWFAQLAAIGIPTAVLTERVTRRFVPLTNLLGMTLVFPDEAPSRFGVALRSGTVRQLEREVEHFREHGLSDDATEAAEQLLVLVNALGKHERLTRGHTERVRAYSELIGQEMALPAHEQDLLRWGALIHDIGKLAVPEPILSKEAQLEDDEWRVIKLHPEVGGALVQPLESWLGEWRLAASEHHERWDGLGYPNGLAGSQISLAGRIVAVADTYDVITSSRSYKDAMSADDARQELVRCSGTQFDPAVVRAFLAVAVGRLHPIAGRFAWLANLGLLFQQAPAAIQTAVVGGAAAATLAGGVATGALEVPEPPTLRDVGVASERVIEVEADETGLVFPSIPQWAIDDTTDDPDETAPPVADAVDPSVPVAPAPQGNPPIATPGAPEPSATVASTSGAPTTSVGVATTTTAVPPTTAAPTTTTPVDPCDVARSGETALSGLDLRGCDLSGLDLTGVRLDQSDLTGADLSSANLTGAILSGAVLVDARFANATLDDARLAGVVAVGADFTDTSMIGARVGGADFSAATFTRAILLAAQGTPDNTAGAVWSDTTCPDGSVQSTDCFG